MSDGIFEKTNQWNLNEIVIFVSQKYIWEWHLQNDNLFVQASVHYVSGANYPVSANNSKQILFKFGID